MACSAAPVAPSRKVSGSASSQAAYSACRARSKSTASHQRRAAAIGGSPVLDHRLGCDTGDAMAGLSLGTTHQPASKLETAYHRADKAIQQIVDLLAA